MTPQTLRELARNLERGAYVLWGCALYGPWGFIFAGAALQVASLTLLVLAIRKQSPGP